MAKMIRKVGLEGVRFVSAIGFFEEERILKNEFSVTISVSFTIDSSKSADLEDLDNTVDYSKLYEICALYFNQEFKLIESVAHKIINKIIANYPFSETIDLKIEKLNPPIVAEIKNSFIELNYKNNSQ